MSTAAAVVCAAGLAGCGSDDDAAPKVLKVEYIDAASASTSLSTTASATVIATDYQVAANRTAITTTVPTVGALRISFTENLNGDTIETVERTGGQVTGFTQVPDVARVLWFNDAQAGTTIAPVYQYVPAKRALEFTFAATAPLPAGSVAVVHVLGDKIRDHAKNAVPTVATNGSDNVALSVVLRTPAIALTSPTVTVTDAGVLQLSFNTPITADSITAAAAANVFTITDLTNNNGNIAIGSVAVATANATSDAVVAVTPAAALPAATYLLRVVSPDNANALTDISGVRFVDDVGIAFTVGS